MSGDRFIVYIASPLEPELVDRIRAVDPDRVEVLYDPDLLPAKRYSIDHQGDPSFVRTAAQEEKWKGWLGRADALWDFPPAALDGTPGMEIARNVKWIQTTSSGVGQRVRKLGLETSEVIITNAAGVHAGPLSEFVFLTLLMHSRRLGHLQTEQQAHRYERFVGDELEGKTLGLVGLGGVGRQVTKIGRSFGMRLVATARRGSEKTAEEVGVDKLFKADKLHTMLAETDALVLSLPHTDDTAGLIDRKAFDALKPGAVFVNIARGSVVDEGALVDALESGKIAFAGLDVFATEPLPAQSPLWDLPNVLISPHSSANADSENGKITDLFCHNLRCCLDRRFDGMKNVFNKERLY